MLQKHFCELTLQVRHVQRTSKEYPENIHEYPENVKHPENIQISRGYKISREYPEDVKHSLDVLWMSMDFF